MQDPLDTLCPPPSGPRSTRIMGVLNVTPDSFSDGGHYLDPEDAVQRAMDMIEQGADILDIGGESSRPGATAIHPTEEIERVLPVIRAIRLLSDIPISLDTVHANVARAGLEAGVNMINDISALHNDHNMAAAISDAHAWVCLMHMQGTPQTMQANPSYTDVCTEVRDFLLERAEAAQAAGILGNRIIIDPGIGFGKTVQHNLTLLRDLSAHWLPYPLLIGASRKSFIAKVLQCDDPGSRLSGSLAAVAAAVRNGAAIVRVHDIRETADFLAVLDAAHPAAAEATHGI